ncbi:hypothetical protein QOV31_005197 (plasmid) [Agrobacterium fabrum]|nr:hypothetical protein QOV31_005197 [Agrobacterium fabrum]
MNIGSDRKVRVKFATGYPSHLGIRIMSSTLAAFSRV